MNEELLYTMALTRLPGIGLIGAHRLMEAVGSATTIFREVSNLKDIVPDISNKVIEIIQKHDVLRLCEAEIRFAEKNNITCLTINDENYPSRLRECDDAPLLLFYKGTANLNNLHVINLVGTRHATDYGKDICQRFIKELCEIMPDTLIISGLAYGIDINAHRAALQYGMDTVGVLAHGLDRIYPSVHRHTAADMLSHGGLITEYPSGTNPDRQNFIKRNRIIAGMSDATIVVESAEKGGALITANIAESYNRDCFAFPGRIGDEYSIGCNNLIRNNSAILLQSAEELVKAMNWKKTSSIHSHEGIQRQLFPELSPEENQIKTQLENIPEGMHINTLVVNTNIPINKITAILFEMEMKGMVRAMAGGMYKLL